MAKATIAMRQGAVDAFRFANDMVRMEAAPPAARASLRATGAGMTSYARTLGFALPDKPAGTTSKGSRHALWLGPDEWLLLDTKDPEASFRPARDGRELTVVDISHRNAAFIVSGTGVTDMLNAACPRNLSVAAFPVKTCSRTILGKAEIVLYRTGRDVFRVECWRSFAPYVRDLLVESARFA